MSLKLDYGDGGGTYVTTYCLLPTTSSGSIMAARDNNCCRWTWKERKEKNPPAAFSLHQHRYQSVVLPIASIIYEAATRNMTADSCWHADTDTTNTNTNKKCRRWGSGGRDEYIKQLQLPNCNRMLPSIKNVQTRSGNRSKRTLQMLCCILTSSEARIRKPEGL